MLKRQLVGIFLFLFLCFFLSAQIPANYYNKAIGKQSAELKTALHEIIRPHTILDYDISTSIWWYTYFKATDWDVQGGYFIDMYSTYKRSSYNGSIMNREHCMPRSWWGLSENYSSFAANGDIVNLSPSDASANSEKSNFPLGIVNSSPSYSNGVVKVGSNTYSGYVGIVFEPANEYKGDFARTYMYMVTCYQDYVNNWRSLGASSMLQRNTFPVFNSYSVRLLMEWHRVDPVSSKEVNRNNEVYKLQNNRNPYIDYPLLAEYLWGKFVGENWDGTNDDPETNSPLIYKYYADNKTVFVQLKKLTIASFAIYSLTGELKQNGNIDAGSLITLKDSNTQNSYEKGVYILSVYTVGRRKTVKLIVY